jgi:hypothetical protein
MAIRRIAVESLGPIKKADIAFGDLTVLAGPQATGKSIFLQLLKLLIDYPAVQSELKRFNIDWRGDLKQFLELYFGEGMASIWGSGSMVMVDGKSRPLSQLARPVKNAKMDERVFFIPAQRVTSLRDGLTRTFSEYRYGDPFCLRELSDKLHNLVQNEFGADPALFPKKNRLSPALRDPISTHIFGNFDLRLDTERAQKRVVLTAGEGGSALPYLVWSAGQREFVPLLLGLYWLCPPARTATRDQIEWAVIEELEMGLHPQAISVCLTLVLELLSRGYRVCFSTHSPHVLDLVWALNFLKKNDGTAKDVRDIFNLAAGAAASKITDAALQSDYKVYYFTRSGLVKDISALDPGASDIEEAVWGGLTEFSGRVSEIVARVAARRDVEEAAT